MAICCRSIREPPIWDCNLSRTLHMTGHRRTRRGIRVSTISGYLIKGRQRWHIWSEATFPFTTRWPTPSPFATPIIVPFSDQPIPTYEMTIFIIDSYLQVQRSARIYLVNGRGGEALAIPATVRSLSLCSCMAAAKKRFETQKFARYLLRNCCMFLFVFWRWSVKWFRPC